MSNKQKVTLMCGIPRCGKSTWIQKNKVDEIVVSPDEIRSKIFGHQFHQNAEGFIWSLAESMALLLLDQGKSLIIDATNITSSARRKWIKVAEPYDCDIEIIVFRTTLEVCKKRNLASKEGCLVPESVICNMAMFFEEPYHPEGNIKITNVSGTGKKIKKPSTVDNCVHNYYFKELKNRRV